MDDHSSSSGRGYPQISRPRKEKTGPVLGSGCSNRGLEPADRAGPVLNEAPGGNID